MAGTGFKAILVLLSIVIVGTALLCLSNTAKADGPSCPAHQFYGTVSDNGKIVGAGYTVSAVVNGQQMASAITNSQGKWGYSQPFTVAAPSGSIIEFYVNGIHVGSAASCIETNQLNLAVSGAPRQSNTFQAGTQAATNIPSQNNPIGLDVQPPSTSNPSGSSASPSTHTFFIGTQPTSANSSTATPIYCSLPGRQDSFTLKNGVLTLAKELDGTGKDIQLSLEANTSINLNGSGQLTVLRLKSLPEPPPNSGVVTAYSFEPQGSTFSPPIILTLKYTPDELTGKIQESGLYIAQLTDSHGWTELSSLINTGDGTVSAQISHFSVYALLGRLITSLSEPAPSSTSNPEKESITGISADIETGKPSAQATQAPVNKNENQQTSGADILVLAVLVIGGILVIVLLLAIIKRRRTDY